MREIKVPREFWIVDSYQRPACISLEQAEFENDGLDKEIIHVREVIEGSAQDIADKLSKDFAAEMKELTK